MSNLGDFAPGTVVYGKFTTYNPTTGAPFTLGGSPVLSVYKDNATTQNVSAVTLTADFDAFSGLNHFAVDTSTDGTFYSAGSFFNVVITTGTVNSVSVTGSVVGSFTLNAVSALRPTTAGRTLDVSAGGEAGVDWANVGSPSTSVSLSATTVNDVSSLTTLKGIAAGAITAAAIANGAIDAATFAADVDAEILSYIVDDATRIDASSLNTATVTTIPNISNNVSDVLVDTAQIGVAGAGLTNINLPDQTMNITGDITGNLSGSVGSVTGAVGSVTGNVDGNVTGTVAGVTPATAAQVAAVLTTQITESYRANAAAPTLAQFMSEVLAHLGEAAIAGTTKTINQLDHLTPAATFTLDDATTPTSITRAT